MDPNQFTGIQSTNLKHLYNLLNHYILRHQWEEASLVGLTMLHAFYKIPTFLFQPLWGLAQLKPNLSSAPSFFENTWRDTLDKVSHLKFDTMLSEVEGMLLPRVTHHLERSEFLEVIQLLNPHQTSRNPFMQGFVAIAKYYNWKENFSKSGETIGTKNLREEVLSSLAGCINIFMGGEVIAKHKTAVTSGEKKTKKKKRREKEEKGKKPKRDNNEFEDEFENGNNNNNENQEDHNHEAIVINNSSSGNTTDYQHISFTQFVRLYCKVTMHAGKRPEALECMALLKKVADKQEKNPSAQELAGIFYLKHAETHEQKQQTVVFFDRLAKQDPTSRLALSILSRFCRRNLYGWFDLLKVLTEHMDYCFQQDTVHQFDKDEITETWSLFELCIENCETQGEDFKKFWKKKQYWLDFFAAELPISTKQVFVDLGILSDETEAMNGE
eukprot:TRINITY_DN7338_c0_g2_i1.p1 TRINITY_DN7338_c0_g2~~TRINITY_DN7338_c0_g2_i1.p1  ORF type:complete len:441 (+),score=83.18 TRINITY_DN7338_c0_g2_i1:166-1488(+)